MWSLSFILYCLSCHFLLGFSVAFLASYWIWTIFRRRWVPLEELVLYTLLFSVFLSLAVHVLEDLLLCWF